MKRKKVTLSYGAGSQSNNCSAIVDNLIKRLFLTTGVSNRCVDVIKKPPGFPVAFGSLSPDIVTELTGQAIPTGSVHE